MARNANTIVCAGARLERPVWRVAVDAGQLRAAGAKTAAGGEHDGLMAGVPRIAKIGKGRTGRGPMAGAAKFIHGRAIEMPRIDRPVSSRVASVCGCGAMTTLTMNSSLGGHD